MQSFIPHLDPYLSLILGTYTNNMHVSSLNVCCKCMACLDEHVSLSQERVHSLLWMSSIHPNALSIQMNPDFSSLNEEVWGLCEADIDLCLSSSGIPVTPEQ